MKYSGTLEPMDKSDLYMVIGGILIIGAGLGFYVARLIFGS